MANDKIKKVEAKPDAKKSTKGVDVDKFIARKLKSLNQMGDQRKAKELAERVMRNSRKGNK